MVDTVALSDALADFTGPVGFVRACLLNRGTSDLEGLNGAVSVSWSNVVYELGGNWFNIGTPTKLIIPADINFIEARASLATDGGTSQILSIRRNLGVSNNDPSGRHPPATFETLRAVTGLMPVEEGDEIDVLYQTDALNNIYYGPFTWFNILGYNINVS